MSITSPAEYPSLGTNTVLDAINIIVVSLMKAGLFVIAANLFDAAFTPKYNELANKD